MKQKKERSCQGINTSIKFLDRRPVRGALCVSGEEDEDEKKEKNKEKKEEEGGMMCQMPVSFSQFYLDFVPSFVPSFSVKPPPVIRPLFFPVVLKSVCTPDSVPVLPLLLLPESSR